MLGLCVRDACHREEPGRDQLSAFQQHPRATAIDSEGGHFNPFEPDSVPGTVDCRLIIVAMRPDPRYLAMRSCSAQE
jgi:hypothetical protein